MNPFLAHCLSVAERYGIRIRYVKDEAECKAKLNARVIYTLPVINLKGYLACQHELAHVILHSHDEVKVWRFVKLCAKGWNKACDLYVKECLESHGIVEYKI